MQRKSTAEIEVLRDLLETQKIQQEKDLTTVQAELVRELLKQSDALIQHRQAIGALLATQEAEIRDKITEIETRLVSSLEALEQHMVAVSQKIDYYVNSSQQAMQQQLMLFTNKQQEHITSLEDRLEQLQNYYVKPRTVKPKHPYQ